MIFRLDITELGNAAFDDDPSREIARLLRVAADRIDNGRSLGAALLDFNGNTVGHYGMIDDD